MFYLGLNVMHKTGVVFAPYHENMISIETLSQNLSSVNVRMCVLYFNELILVT